MPQDYFDDSPEKTGTTTAKPEESGDEQTYVLPKAIAGGKTLKPGDQMTVKIVAEHEDSFEVQNVPEAAPEETETETESDTEEPTEPEETESEMPMKGGMDSMMD